MTNSSYPTTPQQTAHNGIACCYAFAIEKALSKLPPEYHRRIDRHTVEVIIGAHANVISAGQQLQEHYPWVNFESTASSAPAAGSIAIASTWRDGCSGTVVIMDDLEYDPAIGAIVAHRDPNESSALYTVNITDISKVPVANKMMRYFLYRLLMRVFGWDPLP